MLRKIKNKNWIENVYQQTEKTNQKVRSWIKRLSQK